MAKTLVILNPISGNGNGEKLWPQIEAALRAGGVDHLLTARITAEDAPRGKPSPDGYLECLARHGLAAPRLHVADGHELHARLVDKTVEHVGAAAPDADGAEDDPLARGHRAVGAQGPRGDEAGRGGDSRGESAYAFEEPSTTDTVHGLVWFHRMNGVGAPSVTADVWGETEEKGRSFTGSCPQASGRGPDDRCGRGVMRVRLNPLSAASSPESLAYPEGNDLWTPCGAVSPQPLISGTRPWVRCRRTADAAISWAGWSGPAAKPHPGSPEKAFRWNRRRPGIPSSTVAWCAGPSIS